MRLVDADSVTLDLPMYNSFSVGMPLEERLKIMLERQPTVDAIPIEWIKNYRDFMRNKEKGEWLGQFELNVAYGLDIMLGIWEKENEQNKENTSQTDKEN